MPILMIIIIIIIVIISINNSVIIITILITSSIIIINLITICIIIIVMIVDFFRLLEGLGLSIGVVGARGSGPAGRRHPGPQGCPEAHGGLHRPCVLSGAACGYQCGTESPSGLHATPSEPI